MMARLISDLKRLINFIDLNLETGDVSLIQRRWDSRESRWTSDQDLGTPGSLRFSGPKALAASVVSGASALEPYKLRPLRIFLSHSSADKPSVRTLHRRAS